MEHAAQVNRGNPPGDLFLRNPPGSKSRCRLRISSSRWGLGTCYVNFGPIVERYCPAPRLPSIFLYISHASLSSRLPTYLRHVDLPLAGIVLLVLGQVTSAHQSPAMVNNRALLHRCDPTHMHASDPPAVSVQALWPDIVSPDTPRLDPAFE